MKYIKTLERYTKREFKIGQYVKINNKDIENLFFQVIRIEREFNRSPFVLRCINIDDAPIKYRKKEFTPFIEYIEPVYKEEDLKKLEVLKNIEKYNL